MKVEFYNGTKLINSKDKNGDIPEIFVVDGNRSSGKTTYFNRWFVNRFKKYGEKFILLYRYRNEISNVEDKFFSDINGLFFPDDIMTSETREQGLYCELYLNDKLCGWAVPLNMAYKLKKLSHLFADCKRILFDEFQCKTDEYVGAEIDKFVTLHVSLARGKGQPVKYLPVYMVTNHVSSLNPYYKSWGCCLQCDNIQNGFIRGDGFVIEKNMNETVSLAQKLSAFNRSFANTQAVEHTAENKSLCENTNFVERLKDSKYRYIGNITFDGQTVALKAPINNKDVYYYFTDKIDPNIKQHFVFTSDEHKDDTILIGNNYEIARRVREAFNYGFVRFSDIQTKDVAFRFMSLTI